MYLIIGKENCSSCDMTKTVLTNKQIPFQYVLLSELPEEERKQYIALARQRGHLSMPLIIKDNTLYTLKEVIQ